MIPTTTLSGLHPSRRSACGSRSAGCVGAPKGGARSAPAATRTGKAPSAPRAPFALRLLALAEAGGTPAGIIHPPLGATLLGPRLSHGQGIARRAEDVRLRLGATAATLALIGSGAVAALLASFGASR